MLTTPTDAHLTNRSVLVRVRRDDVGGPQLMQAAMERVARMSHRFGSQQGLSDSCWQGFASKSPFVAIWVVRNGPEVVGHAVGQIAEHEWRRVAWIYHVECDHVMPTAMLDAFTKEVEAWVAEYNAAQAAIDPSLCVYEIMMNSHRGMESKVWERHGGFEPYRTVFRRLLHDTKKAINSTSLKKAREG